ncbi:hypothetical protein CRUP_025651 [Coryphaenoides rupestris]|nr:hypothetical protein CRUP_025651 [Coryphaenoides rupestris]
MSLGVNLLQESIVKCNQTLHRGASEAATGKAPLESLECRTSVWIHSPVSASHTLSVRSVEPLMITFSRIWDDHTPPVWPTSPHKHQSAVTCLQFNKNFVITSSDDGTVKLWDLRTGEFIRNLVTLESGGSGGVVWRIRASNTKLVCAVGSRNGTEETKLLVLDFDVDMK